MSVADRLAEAFVGRAAELEALRRAADDAAAGRGRVVFVSGDPGIGKTRLAQALATYAQGRGARLAWGRCHEGAPAFWPWQQIVRACTRELGAPLLRRVLEAAGCDLGSLVPELRPGELEAPSPEEGDSSQARFRLFDGVVRLLDQVARLAPVVVLLDDAHAADRSSLQLLQFASRELRDAPLLLLVAYRGPAASPEHPLAPVLAEAVRAPGTVQLGLRGLGLGEIRELLAQTSDGAPEPRLAEALHRQTEGNPLFVAEVVRSLSGERRLDLAAAGAEAKLPLPDSLKAVLLRRLRERPARSAEILSLAAVMGRAFERDALASGFDAGEVDATLRQALAEGLLAEVAGRSGAYRFTHGLMRDAVYDGLEPERREQLHRHAAEALERMGDAEGRSPELAHHFLAAGRKGDATKACRYARIAAERATRLAAYEDAGRLHEMALSALERGAAAPPPARCEILLALAATQTITAERGLAQETSRRAAAEARQLGAGHGWQVAAALLARAALAYGGDPGGGVAIAEVVGLRPQLFDPEQVNLIEEALAVLPQDDGDLRARLLARLAVELYHITPFERRDALSADAVSMARRLGDPGTLAYTLCMRHVAAWAPHNAEERAALGAELAAVAERHDDRGLLAMGHGWRLLALLELGQVDDMEREAALFARTSEESRQPFFAWSVTVLGAMRALLSGRFEESERLVYEARRLGRSCTNTAEMFYNLQLVALRREQGRLAELDRLLEFLRAAVDLHTAIPSLRTQLAFLYAELGRPAEARVQFEAAAAEGFADFPRNMVWLASLVEAAEACAALGDAERARLLYDLLLPHAAHHAVGLGSTTCWGSVARSLGRLATTMGRYEEAERHLDAALVANRRLSSPTWVAHTQHAQALLRLARGGAGEAERAASLLEQARATAATLGMRRLLEQVEAAMGAAAAAPAPPRRETPAPEANLLRHEGDYWTISFEGTALRLRDTNGLHYLAELLRAPAPELHVLRLVDRPQRRRAGRGSEGSALGGIEAVRRGLAELRAELDEAERFNDGEKAARLRQRLEAVEDEAGSALAAEQRAVERARLMVTKRIKAVVAKIRGEHQALAHHLATSIKTGYVCVYLPDPRHPARWRVEVAPARVK